MNVHPTKREVKFLDEAAIIDHIQECLDALLQGTTQRVPYCALVRLALKTYGVTGGNESRTFYTQMLLTGVDSAAVRQSQQEERASLGGEGSEKQVSGAQ